MKWVRACVLIVIGVQLRACEVPPPCLVSADGQSWSCWELRKHEEAVR